jgi:hypothetical protein
MAKTKTKRWKVDAGNSSTGQAGFVVYDVKAASAEEALRKVKEGLPESIEDTVYVAPGDGPWKLLIYINTDTLTVDQIEEDDDDDEGEDR